MDDEEKIMDLKYKDCIPLIVILFILGIAIGYVAHRPETIEKPVYINNTIKEIVKETVIVTPAPESTSIETPGATPAISNFTVKNYDATKDKSSNTIELTNWRANPENLYIHPGDKVLIKIVDYNLQTPLILKLNSHTDKLGTSGSRIITFNNIGTYSFKAILETSDPNVIPRTYAEGTIRVN